MGLFFTFSFFLSPQNDDDVLYLSSTWMYNYWQTANGSVRYYSILITAHGMPQQSAPTIIH